MRTIQQVRKELNDLINLQVKPLRQELDALLNAEAARICPFSLGETIELDNGKLGQITEIKYLSNDYNFAHAYHMSEDEVDINYIYAYHLDDEEFSITWTLSGLRMNKDGNVGKLTFIDVSPISHNVDKVNKSVKRKKLPDILGDGDFLSFNALAL